MTTPASGPISLSDIQNELGFTIATLDQFYLSSLVSGGGGLMYHNLNMGISNADSAAASIWSYRSNGGPYAISNWYNYSQDPEFVFEYYINNASPYDVEITIILKDSNTVTVATVFTGVVNSGMFTGGLSFGPFITVIGFGGYSVYVSDVKFIPPPAPGITFGPIFLNVTTSYDTDGVGPGTNRTTYSLPSHSEAGPTPPFYGDQLAVDNNGAPIPINKRTTIVLNIT